MFLILSLCGNVLYFIGGAVKFGGDEPWTSEWID